MTSEEFYSWLDTCPTHKWEIIHYDRGYVQVMFPIISDDEEEEDET